MDLSLRNFPDVLIVDFIIHAQEALNCNLHQGEKRRQGDTDDQQVAEGRL